MRKKPQSTIGASDKVHGKEFPAKADLQKLNPIKNTRRLKLHLGLIVAAVAFILYANTLGHEYVLDDYIFITGNSMTQSGIKAIPDIFTTGYMSSYEHNDYHNYRPVTKSVFAIEWQCSPNNSTLCHWVNVLLYTITCFLLFYTLALYLNRNLVIPFLAALFFAVHPIHTEAVANIKSLDEILAMLFFLAASIGIYNYVVKNSVMSLALSAFFIFLSLLSKESAITFLAVIALMIYFFTNSKRHQRIIAVITLCIVACAYLAIRKIVLGNQTISYLVIENYLYGITDIITQKATAIFLTGVYLKLLFIPHPLMSDGSLQQFPVVHVLDPEFIVTALVFLLMAVIAVISWLRRKTF